MWYGYCSKLFEKLRREVNFGNSIAKILTEKDDRGERNDVTVKWENNWIFGNEITEIPSCLISTAHIDVHEVSKGGSAQRKSAQEKTNRGNQVVEIQKERKKKIVAIKLPKMREKNKKPKV